MERLKKGLLGLLTLLVFMMGCAPDIEMNRQKRAAAKETFGLSKIRSGDIQGGLKELIEAAEIDPENADIQNDLGVAYYSLKEIGKAVFHFKKALYLRPDFSEVHNVLGRIYAEIKQYDQAVYYLNLASGNEIYRFKHFAWNDLGTVYHAQGKFEEAVKSYKKAIILSQKFSMAYDNMGLAYEKLKDWDAAIEAYGKSIEHTPNFPISHLHLGRLYFQLNRLKEAEKSLIKAIETDQYGQYSKEAENLLKQINSKKFIQK